MEKRSKIVIVGLAISALALLSACGGGGGGTESPVSGGGTESPVGGFSVLKVFSDGSGVGRAVSNSDGSQLVFISPDITEIVAGASQVTPSGLTDIQFSDFPITSTTPTANIHEGTVTDQVITANVFVVEDNGGEATFIVVDFGSDDVILLLAGGSAYGGVPSGEFTYQGTQGIGRRDGTTPRELGTFSLTANFDAETFSYDGSSANSAVFGSGSIDTVNGRFATSTLDVTAGGSDYTGTMHGLLHGSSSQSVSGVFHTNDDNPDYAGAFVGSR